MANRDKNKTEIREMSYMATHRKDLGIRLIRFVGIMIILAVVSDIVYAQSRDEPYKIMGRIINKDGIPIRGVDVYISPFYDESSKIYDLLEVSSVSDSEGRFYLNAIAKPGEVQYLYTSLSVRGEELISPPFSFVNQHDRRLLGQSIIFGSQSIIDVGDMPVQFRFGTVAVAIMSGGQLLKKEDWLRLWVILRNDKNIILSQRSLGPDVAYPKIDIGMSTIYFALPYGNWKLEFHSFDEQKSPPQIGKVILGTTDVFNINSNSLLNISANLRHKDQIFPVP